MAVHTIRAVRSVWMRSARGRAHAYRTHDGGQTVEIEPLCRRWVEWTDEDRFTVAESDKCRTCLRKVM